MPAIKSDILKLSILVPRLLNVLPNALSAAGPLSIMPRARAACGGNRLLACSNPAALRTG